MADYSALIESTVGALVKAALVPQIDRAVASLPQEVTDAIRDSVVSRVQYEIKDKWMIDRQAEAGLRTLVGKIVVDECDKHRERIVAEIEKALTPEAIASHVQRWLVTIVPTMALEFVRRATRP